MADTQYNPEDLDRLEESLQTSADALSGEVVQPSQPEPDEGLLENLSPEQPIQPRQSPTEMSRAAEYQPPGSTELPDALVETERILEPSGPQAPEPSVRRPEPVSLGTGEEFPPDDVEAFIQQQHSKWLAEHEYVNAPEYDVREDAGLSDAGNMRKDLEDFASNMSESYESVHQSLNILSDIVSGHGRNVVDINARLLRWGII